MSRRPRTSRRIRLAVSLALFLFYSRALAQDSVSHEQPRVAYGVENDWDSAYVWRGIVIDDRPSMQPSAWISAAGFTLAAWSNIPLASGSRNTDLHEGSLSLAYDGSWKKLDIEPRIGAFLNRRPGMVNGPNTAEAALDLSYPVGPLRLFTSHSFDVLAYRGSYFGEAGARYERPLTERLELAASLKSGWASSKFNDVYIGVDKPAFNLIGIAGSLTYHLTKHLYLQPHVEFSDIVDHRLRSSLARPTFVHFGLALGFDF